MILTIRVETNGLCFGELSDRVGIWEYVSDLASLGKALSVLCEMYEPQEVRFRIKTGGAA